MSRIFKRNLIFTFVSFYQAHPDYRCLLIRDTNQEKIIPRCHHNENSNFACEPDNGPIVVMNLSLWSPNFSSTVHNALRYARGRAFAATRLHVCP